MQCSNDSLWQNMRSSKREPHKRAANQTTDQWTIDNAPHRSKQGCSRNEFGIRMRSRSDRMSKDENEVWALSSQQFLTLALFNRDPALRTRKCVKHWRTGSVTRSQFKLRHRESQQTMTAHAVAVTRQPKSIQQKMWTREDWELDADLYKFRFNTGLDDEVKIGVVLSWRSSTFRITSILKSTTSSRAEQYTTSLSTSAERQSTRKTWQKWLSNKLDVLPIFIHFERVIHRLALFNVEMQLCSAKVRKRVTPSYHDIDMRGCHNFSAAFFDQVPVRQMNFVSTAQKRPSHHFQTSLQNKTSLRDLTDSDLRTWSGTVSQTWKNVTATQTHSFPFCTRAQDVTTCTWGIDGISLTPCILQSWAMCPRLSLEKHRRSSVDGSCCPFCPRLLFLPLQRWLQLNLSLSFPLAESFPFRVSFATGRDRAPFPRVAVASSSIGTDTFWFNCAFDTCMQLSMIRLTTSSLLFTVVSWRCKCRCTAAGAPEVMTTEEMTLTSAHRLRWSTLKQRIHTLSVSVDDEWKNVPKNPYGTSWEEM